MGVEGDARELLERVWLKLQGLPDSSPADITAFTIIIIFMLMFVLLLCVACSQCCCGGCRRRSNTP